MAEITLDFDQITSRMLIDFKAKTGTSLMAMVDDAGEVDLKALAQQGEEMVAGMVWLALRTSGQPDATWDDALDVPFSQLQFAGDDEDPTSASSKT